MEGVENSFRVQSEKLDYKANPWKKNIKELGKSLQIFEVDIELTF